MLHFFISIFTDEIGNGKMLELHKMISIWPSK
jgi:hypothetical protein